MADITGTPGDDVLAGTADNDSITGLDGNDILAGLDGNDDLNGGPGNDLMVGGRGSDTKAGEHGNDRFIWNNGDGSDAMDGGADFDAQEVNGAVAAGDEFQVDAGADGAAVFQRVNLVPFSLTMQEVEFLDVRGLGGDDRFTVGNLAGTHLVQGLTWRGGDGDDELDARHATTTIIAFGEDGDDTLRGGSASDILSGGDGKDTFVFARGSGTDTVLDFDPAEDRLELQGFDDPSRQLRGDDGTLVLDFSEGDVLVLQGVGDVLNSSAHSAGNIMADTTIMAGITGTPGDDVLAGTADNDSITGLDGNDILAGLDGNDDLNGGPGNDLMVGGRGADTKAGEHGNDRFIWNNGDGSDAMDGGADFDTQEVNGAVAAGDEFQVDAGADGAAVFQRVNLVPFSLTMQGVESLTVRGLGGDDRFTVGNLAGTAVQAVGWRGGDGDDELDARHATTPIQALGQDGDDTLRGGSASDILSGGDGKDTFVFARGSGTDIVVDFDPAEDRLELQGFDDPPRQLQDGSLVLDFGDGDVLVLPGVGDFPFG